MADTTSLTSARYRHKSAEEDGGALKAFLADQMQSLLAVPARTKRSAARLALMAAIREGHLKPGMGLPPEKALTSILGVSLGTVQAALRQLQQAGTIIRRRGDGSRVATVEPLADSIWHFRFISKHTGHPLRFDRQGVQLDRIADTGPWSDYLGACTTYIRIKRRMTMSDGSVINAEMYLDDKAAPGLADIDPQEFDMASVRPYLEEAFGLSTAGARHSVSVARFGKTAAGALGIEPGRSYFEIHAKAFSSAGSPVYFQRIFALSSACILDF